MKATQQGKKRGEREDISQRPQNKNSRGAGAPAAVHGVGANHQANPTDSWFRLWGASQFPSWPTFGFGYHHPPAHLQPHHAYGVYPSYQQPPPQIRHDHESNLSEYKKSSRANRINNKESAGTNSRSTSNKGTATKKSNFSSARAKGGGNHKGMEKWGKDISGDTSRRLVATASVVRGPSFSAATGKEAAAETAGRVTVIKQDKQRMRTATAERAAFEKYSIPTKEVNTPTLHSNTQGQWHGTRVNDTIKIKTVLSDQEEPKQRAKNTKKRKSTDSSESAGLTDASSKTRSANTGVNGKVSINTVVLSTDADIEKVVKNTSKAVAIEIRSAYSSFGINNNKRCKIAVEYTQANNTKDGSLAENSEGSPLMHEESNSKSFSCRRNDVATAQVESPCRTTQDVNTVVGVSSATAGDTPVRYNEASLSLSGAEQLVDTCDMKESPLDIDNVDTTTQKQSSTATSTSLNKVARDCFEYDIDTKDDANKIATAVERFALEVYCPFLLASKHCMGNTSPKRDRIIISTLLAIQEMLILNADTFFSKAHPFKNDTVGSSRVQHSLSLVARVYAAAILRTSAKRMGEHLFADFIRATRSYDSQGDDFQFALKHADVRARIQLPNGNKLGREESVLAKVSFNYTRERHPLLCNDEINAKDNGVAVMRHGQSTISVPTPNKCVVFVMKNNRSAEGAKRVSVSNEFSSDDEEYYYREMKRYTEAMQVNKTLRAARSAYDRSGM
eukprot:scaffold61_cov205-Alexandrium_tamarense.AAC.28